MSRRQGSRRQSATVGLVLLLQLAACVAVALMRFDDVPHHAPVVIVAPAVVSTELAARADALDGSPLSAQVTTSEAAAREAVEQGRAVAAVVVDLAAGDATLLVASVQGPALTESVGRAISDLAEPFAATITTEDLTPDDPPRRGELLLVVALAVVAGFVIALVLTWRRGPVTDTGPAARRRLAVAAVTGALTAAILALLAQHELGGPVLVWWCLLWMTVSATSASTLALEALLGAPGLGVATTAFVVLAAPLVRVDHVLLVPSPWDVVTGWLPHGAAIDAGGQIAWFGAAGLLEPVLVLGSWIVVSLVLIMTARRERRLAGVVW